MKAYYDYNNIFIIEDPQGTLKEEGFNIYINKILVDEKEIEPDDPTLERCVRKKNYVLIEGHGSFRKQKLKKLVLDYLRMKKISYSLHNMNSEKLPDEITRYTSKKLFLGTTHGGTVKDSIIIDPKVEKLCTALNSYPGIRTFSSCEGHGDEHRTFYVLFKVDTLKTLEEITKIIRDSMNEAHSRLNTDLDKVNVSLNYNFGDWVEIPGVFFEIRICFSSTESKEAYTFTDLVSDLLSKNKKTSTYLSFKKKLSDLWN